MTNVDLSGLHLGQDDVEALCETLDNAFDYLAEYVGPEVRTKPGTVDRLAYEQWHRAHTIIGWLISESGRQRAAEARR